MKINNRTKNIIFLIVIIVLAVLFIPVLAVNVTLIVKGNVNKDVPPDIFGVAPLAVVSPSMSGPRDDSFDEGALVFIKILDEEGIQALKTGDVICFRADDMYVTHRIIAENRSDSGELISVVTMGDANSVADQPVPVGDIFGICTGSAAGLGKFAMFLQTPVGILVFVGIPVLLFIGYDVLRIYLKNKGQVRREEADRREEEMRDKDEEIRRLQALLNEREGANPPPEEKNGED